MNLRVEAAPAAALELLAALHARCFAQAWSRASFAKLLATPGAFALLAVEQDEPVGLSLARAAGGEAEILTLGVTPAARRQGAGRALVEATAAEALARGAKDLFLEVAEDNVAARALYLSLGFAQVGRRARYYGPRDALVLRRAI
jgi:[ribosomal protein S18]-alanine N-acetyltransferase